MGQEYKEEDDSSEETQPTENEETGEDITPEQKNKSNWKRVNEANKSLKRDLATALEELEKVKEWAVQVNPEGQDIPFSKKEIVAEDKVANLEKKIFLSDNKEAKEYLDKIEEVRNKYGMDLEDAWDFVKAKLPPESKTKKDFDLGGKVPTAPKDFTKITMEESAKLSKEDRAKWRKANNFA